MPYRVRMPTRALGASVSARPIQQGKCVQRGSTRKALRMCMCSGSARVAEQHQHAAEPHVPVLRTQ